MPDYVFTMKSKEELGASQFNGVKLELASDADAEAFADNLEACFAADVVTVNKVLDEDYSEPYPAGTNVVARAAMWSADDRTEQIHLRDVASGADLADVAADLIAAGIRLPSYDVAVTSINFSQFTV